MPKLKKLIHVVFVLGLLVAGCGKTTVQPVNPHVSKEAKELLNYLYSISGNYTLAGQHNYAHELNRSSDSVKSITGKYPVIWGSDFSSIKARKQMINMAVRKADEGFIVTLMYHEGAPVKDIPKGVNPVRYVMSEAEWNDLVTSGTKINKRWLADIDSVAAYLKILRDKNVPVLWRPYHEMNGTWFWWCNKKGENGIKKLWKMMYDRFVNYHHLNNLLWVWNANAPRDWKNDEAYAYDLYYPGNAYVDILATDIYKNDYKQSHHDDLLKLGNGKIIALGECGILPTPEILDRMNKFVWFMDWARFIWEVNDPIKVRELYNSERVLTFDEYDKRRKGDDFEK